MRWRKTVLPSVVLLIDMSFRLWGYRCRDRNVRWVRAGGIGESVGVYEGGEEVM